MINQSGDHLQRPKGLSFNKIIAIIIQYIILIAILVCKINREQFGYVVLVCLIIIEVINYILQKKLITLSNISILMLFTLYLVFYVISVFGINTGDYSGYDLWGMFSSELVLKTGKFCLTSVIVINISLCATVRPITISRNLRFNGFFHNNYLVNQVKKVSKFLFYILLPIIIINDVSKISLVYRFGRNFMLMNGTFLSRFESLFIISAIIYIISNKYLKPLVVMIVRSILLIILTGSRLDSLIQIILFVFVYSIFLRERKRNNYKIVAIVLLIILLIPLLSYVGETRGSSRINLLDYLKSSNPYISFISNIGTASLITSCFAEQFTYTNEFLLGKTYAASLLTILPLSTRIFPTVEYYRSVSSILNEFAPRYGTQGGSIFAEMYMNFGYFSMIIAVIFGVLIGKTQNMIYISKNNNNLITASISIFFYYSILIISRANFYDVVVSFKQILYFLIVWWVVSTIRFRGAKVKLR